MLYRAGNTADPFDERPTQALAMCGVKKPPQCAVALGCGLHG